MSLKTLVFKIWSLGFLWKLTFTINNCLNWNSVPQIFSSKLPRIYEQLRIFGISLLFQFQQLLVYFLFLNNSEHARINDIASISIRREFSLLFLSILHNLQWAVKTQDVRVVSDGKENFEVGLCNLQIHFLYMLRQWHF